MTELIGHQNLLVLLGGMHERGRLGHALLFVGSKGVGKMALAQALTAKIVGLELPGPCSGGETLPLHTDVTVLERQLNDKGSIKAQVSVEQVRGLRGRLQKSSFSGTAKVGIIKDAETLTVQAQNAILKTLEEPSANTYLILLTTDKEALLPTILSRCQTVHVPLVARKTIGDALVKRGVLQESAHTIAGLSCGRPEVAIKMLRDPEYKQEIEEQISEFHNLVSGGLTQAIGALGAKAKSSRESVLDSLKIWELYLHDVLLVQAGLQERTALSGFASELQQTAAITKLDQVSDFLQRLTEAKKAIIQNVNVTLALEHIFI